jgi:DNA-binding beta-propeller fold protein YncE
MERRPRLVPRRGAWLAPASVLLTACLLDLGSLSNGGATSTGGGAATSSSAGSGGGGGVIDAGDDGAPGDAGDGGDAAGCALLDCACASGATVIAAGAAVADIPRGVAVTADGVYWVNQQGNEVRRLPAGGGPPEQLASTPSPLSIAVSGDTVVWTADDGIHACQASSCDGTAHLVSASAAPGSLRDVAFDGQIVTWTDHGTGSQDGKARACPLAACGAPDDLDTNLTAPEGLAYHGDSAFWIDQGNGNQNGNIQRELKVGGNYAQLAAALDLPMSIAVDDTNIYWTAWLPAGHVYRCPYAAGYCNTPEDLAPAGGPLGRPFDIHVGGGRIYWSNTDDGSITSCPQPGCGGAKPKVHVTGRQGLHRLAVGASCLFWTEDGGGGAVLKMAR